MSKTRSIIIECKDGALIVNDTETGRFVLKQPYSIQSNAECQYLFIKDNSQRVYVPFNFVESEGSFSDLVSEIETCSCLPQSVSVDDVAVLPIEIEKQLTFLGISEYWANTDLDIAEQKRKIYKIQQVCLPSGEIVFVEFGKDINDTNNHLTRENLTMDFTGIGQTIIESPLVVTEVPFGQTGITVCSDGTAQDVVALIQPTVDAFIAELTANGYPNAASLALTKVGLQQVPNKQPVHCDITGVDAVTSSGAAIPVLGLGNDSVLKTGSQFPYGRPLFDNGECKGCAPTSQGLVAGDVIATGGVGTAYVVDFCVACLEDVA